ncbi:hypothetical protein F2P79_024570 [Pimephales promelas]|nr:hypothetical protein F2P79_024570 [Pimephales promelas]
MNLEDNKVEDIQLIQEEGEFLPKYTCPVANMEFRLNRLRTCDIHTCTRLRLSGLVTGFQKSFSEDSNYLSLVIGPQRRVTDSLRQYFKVVLLLLVMRFDVTSSMSKLKDRVQIPEEFSLSSSPGVCVSSSNICPLLDTYGLITHLNDSASGRRLL